MVNLVVVLCGGALVRHEGLRPRETVVRCADAITVAYGQPCTCSPVSTSPKSNTREHNSNTGEYKLNTRVNKLNAREYKSNTGEHKLNTREHKLNTREHQLHATKHKLNNTTDYQLNTREYSLDGINPIDRSSVLVRTRSTKLELD